MPFQEGFAVPIGLITFWIFAIQAGDRPGPTLPREGTLSVQDMAGMADIVGVATVRTAAPRRDGQTGLVYTDFGLNFSEVWKGSPGDSFVLVKAGGRLGDQASAVVGREYVLNPGESVVVFATRSQLGNHAVIGLRQGLYRVGDGPDPAVFRISEFPSARGPSGGPRLSGLRDQVFRALGRSDAPLAPPGGGEALPAPRKAGSTPAKDAVPGGAPRRDAAAGGSSDHDVAGPSRARYRLGAALLGGALLAGIGLWMLLRRRP
jgi:hypothetical protein